MMRRVKTKPTQTYTLDELEELYMELNEGDLLEFQRTAYAHWAVYVGVRKFKGKYEQCVIHRAVPADANKKKLFVISKSTTESIGEVTLESIESVLGNDRVRINNEMDNEWTPKDVREIIARADKARRMAELNPLNDRYNLLTNNCEHFANSCRYGRHKGRQVQDVIIKGAGSVAGAAATIGARQLATYGACAAFGVTISGPVGWAVAGVGVGITLVVPWIVHGVQCRRK